MSDLPDELWCTIFDYLDLVELKDASLICRRWAKLTFSGRRMNRVALVYLSLAGYYFPKSNRKYRHVRLGECFGRTSTWYKIVRKYSLSILTLEIEICSGFTSRQLQRMFTHLPNLQHLTITDNLKECTKSIIPYELLPKLKYLSFDIYQNRSAAVRLCMAAPYLECLHMSCNSAQELDVYRHFSGQLKLIFVRFEPCGLFYNSFLELNFPCLEELSVDAQLNINGYDPETSHKFFRRHTSLRRLSIKSNIIPKALMEIITGYCNQLTHLSVTFCGHSGMRTQDDGTFGLLSQLTRLKYFKLEGYLGMDIFQGCNAINSLETIEVGEFTCVLPLTLLQNLCAVAPQLTCLKYEPKWLRTMTIQSNCRVVRFIASNFSKLTRLTLRECPDMPHSFCIDQFLELRELEIRCGSMLRYKIYKYFPRNNVRFLERIGYPMPINGKSVPRHFYKLQRLTLVPIDCNHSESSFDWLRRLLPETRIYVHRSVRLTKLLEPIM